MNTNQWTGKGYSPSFLEYPSRPVRRRAFQQRIRKVYWGRRRQARPLNKKGHAK